jgi:hypothetical protein
MEKRMKVYLKTLAVTLLLTVPAAAQTGNIHGTESRGEPLNSSYRASGVDPATGYTPGYYRGSTASTVRVQKQKKKKRVIYAR